MGPLKKSVLWLQTKPNVRKILNEVEGKQVQPTQTHWEGHCGWHEGGASSVGGATLCAPDL